MLDLSIIVVSFNTKELIKNCIESVVKNTKEIKYEIIVIDNASTDDSVKTVRQLRIAGCGLKGTRNAKHATEKRVSLKIIKNKKNLGFGRANNQGVKIAEGKYILFLNSDTLIKDNVLSGMVSWMEGHPDVGVSTCALKNADGSLQGTGGYFPDLFRAFAWMFFLENVPVIDQMMKPFHPMHQHSFFYKGVGQFKKKQERDWVTGAFFLTRRKVIEKVGDFGKDYFMYTEEVDLCWRIKKAGWKVWYLPKWSITHFGGASATSEFSILSEYKGVKMFYRKNKPEWQLPILRIFLKGGALLRIALFGVLNGKGVAKTYVKAFKIA